MMIIEHVIVELKRRVGAEEGTKWVSLQWILDLVTVICFGSLLQYDILMAESS